MLDKSNNNSVVKNISSIQNLQHKYYFKENPLNKSKVQNMTESYMRKI